MRGKVKWFNEVKGFGFITGEDGKDAFVHRNDLATGELPQEGQTVEFYPQTGPRGLKATAVKLLTIVFCLLAVACCLPLGGCSDLQARGDMGAAIEKDATAAQAFRASITAGTATTQPCADYLAQADGRLAAYDAAVTVNMFSYWFGGKQIYASPEFAKMIGMARDQADNFVARKFTSADDLRTAAGYCARWIIDIQKAKDGQK